MSFVMYIVLLISVHVTDSNFDYCSITCNGKIHTMCKYKQGGDPTCAVLRRGLTKDQKKFLVNIHNEIRDSAAVGKGPSEAANMMTMEWCDEGEMIAQRWADQCTEGVKEDGCRSLQNNEPGGQIVDVVGKVEIEDTYNVIRNTVLNWYHSNKSHFAGESVSHYKFDPKTFAFTQLIWARSDRFGCGYSWGELDGEMVHRLVCNYYPAGNIEGDAVYVVGRACSQCPFVQCSKQWRGLCAHKTKSNWDGGRGSRTAGNAPLVIIVVVVSLIAFYLT